MKKVEAVGGVQIAGARSGDVGVPVLPDDALRAHADHDDAVTVVDVDRDQPGSDARRKRRMIELSGPGGGAVPPEDAARACHDDRMPRPRVVGEQDPVRREQLRVGRIRDRRSHRPAQAPVRAEVVDPRAVDLADERAAVGERRRAVDRAELRRRVVPADAGAVLLHDPVRAGDEEDAAVVRVGDRDDPARQEIRVIGGVEISRRASTQVHMSVAPEHAATRKRDDLDRVLVLLVRDDPIEARAEECVVVEAKRHCGGAPGLRVRPVDPLRAVDEEHSVVAAIRDQQVTGQRPGRGKPGRRDAVPRRRRRRGRGGRVLLVADEHADHCDRDHGACSEHEPLPLPAPSRPEPRRRPRATLPAHGGGRAAGHVRRPYPHDVKLA